MTMQTLLDVVDDLTLPKIQWIEQEVLEPIMRPRETAADPIVQAVDETGELRWLNKGTKKVPARSDALLQQLTDAITASMGGPSGKGKLAHERLPLDADALGRAIRITAEISAWCAERRLRVEKDDPIANLRAWYTSTLSVNAFDADGYYLGVLQGWAREVEGLLNRWDEAEVDEPCPRCGATTWLAADDLEDSAGRPRPLVYKFRRTDGEQMIDRAWAHCRACDPTVIAPWRIEALRDEIATARVLGPSMEYPLAG